MDDLCAARDDTEGTGNDGNVTTGERLRQAVSGDTACAAPAAFDQHSSADELERRRAARAELVARAAGIRRASCPQCGDTFDCGVAATACWCQSMPPLDLHRRPANLVGQGCVCAGCLRAMLAATPINTAQRA